jgi:photosynthetic reaction center cytochrome c subunit
MNGLSRKAVFAVAGFALTLALPSDGMRAQSVAAEPAPLMAEGAYKNIQVLNGVPASQIFPIMNFFSASLGVGCNFCHESEREKDSLPAKVMTRKMVQMMFAINSNTFNGRLEVTCYSCHRGSTRSVGMPLVTSQESKPAPAEADEVGGTYPGEMPSVDQLLDKYVTALGGAGAIQNISSRVVKGTVTDAEGRKSPMEVLAKAPAKRISVIHLAKGDIFTLYNGDMGWIRSPNELAVGTLARDMKREDLDAARMEDPLCFAGRVQQVFTDLRVERPEKVGGREKYVVSGRTQNLALVKLYFDKESGMLTRLVHYDETEVGSVPLQIDYADYRNADGVKIPFQWTIDQPRGRGPRFTYEVDEVQQNISIDDSRFTVPASVGCHPPRCSAPRDFNFGLPNPHLQVRDDPPAR